MRNDVGVNGGIVQIIPELSYIIQISFFYSPSSFIRYHCLVLWHILPRSLSVQTDLISIPLCSSDIAAPPRGVCWDWNEDQVTHHSKACWERPGGRETKRICLWRCLYVGVHIFYLLILLFCFCFSAVWCLCLFCVWFIFLFFVCFSISLCVSFSVVWSVPFILYMSMTSIALLGSKNS